MDRSTRLLFVTIAILVGIIVALLAGMLSRANGSSIPEAIFAGGSAFIGSVTLVLLVMGVAGVFETFNDLGRK